MLAIVPVAISLACAALPYNLTSQAISAQISSRGANTVLSELYNSEEAWPVVLTHIRTGAVDWLKLGAKLQRVSDAGASEELEEAFFFALAPNPTETLRLASPGSIPMVCSSNFLVDYPANKTSVHWVDERLRKVGTVKDPSLGLSRDACIQELRQAREDVLNSMHSGQ
jgi:hypothetical protein